MKLPSRRCITVEKMCNSDSHGLEASYVENVQTLRHTFQSPASRCMKWEQERVYVNVFHNLTLEYEYELNEV
jgi:hypothetical protein